MKKITLPLLVAGLVLTSSTFAMNHGEKNYDKMGNMGKSCDMMQNMTEEERIQFIQSKMGSGYTMSGSCINKGKMGDIMKNMKGKGQMMGSGMMMGNNKVMSAVHTKVMSFFDKLDKEVTDNVKKVDILKKIDAKITTILKDSSLTSAKKAVYTHIQHMIQMRIDELESIDIDLDGLLNINQ